MKILLATDGSEHSGRAAKFLTNLNLSSDDEITVLHVISEVLPSSLKQIKQEIAPKIIGTAMNILRPLNAKITSVLIDGYPDKSGRFTKVNSLTKDGDPSLVIVDTATMLKTDIIVVGSKGMRGIKGMLGSVSRYILGHSECSVLIGKTGE